MAKRAMPVLIGAGQAVSRWDGSSGPAGAPSPLSLAVEASLAALADAGGADLAASIDLVAFVRIHEDSTSRMENPHGRVASLPVALARQIGAQPRLAVYSSVGGQTPQALVNEMARRIHEGEIETALIVGSQALGASRAAQKLGTPLDWSGGSDDASGIAVDDRGLGERLLSRPEIKHGLVAPAYFYALMETAIAAREGRTRSEHRRVMAELFAPFSEVAARNPFAQFPIARSADFLATPSRENYELADPYLKWHVAQDAVNLGAAVLLVSEAVADQLGVPAARRVHLHGGGEAHDRLLSERNAVDRSWAMETALTQALDAAGRTAAQIDMFDLYSCFPCAVTCAASAIGIDPRRDGRPLTVTGGLPFFGGPGNNYPLHAIASTIAALRGQPGKFGLVLANGGWMTKEAAGVYSMDRPVEFASPLPSMTPVEPPVELIFGPAEALVEAHTVTHGRNGPDAGIAFLRTASGARIIARATASALARLREDRLAVGERVSVTTESEVNTFAFV
jgi:acetyl-CoA C-acetyltransferase